jgi:hypothetical protein
MLPFLPLGGGDGGGVFAMVLQRLPAGIKRRGKPLKSRVTRLSSPFFPSSGNNHPAQYVRLERRA